MHASCSSNAMKRRRAASSPGLAVAGHRTRCRHSNTLEEGAMAFARYEVSTSRSARFPLGLFALAAGLAQAGTTAPSPVWEWQNPLPQPNVLRAAAFSGLNGIAVGDSGTLLTSPDGG